jgi:hypothetical protein
MPHFYFDSRDNGTFIEDDIGLMYPSIETARDEASRTLAEMAREVLPGSMRRELAIEVRDERKLALLRTSLVFEAIQLQ